MSSGAPEAFHPERVAYYEAAGWRAYYDHRWLRALAAKTVDRITGRYSTDVAGGWRLVEASLQQAYQAVPQG